MAGNVITLILEKLGLRKPESDAQKLLDSMDERFEAFKNRPIYQSLTEQIIDETKDEELLQRVFDSLSETPSLYQSEFEIVMSWNKARQAIYLIWILEAEVNNGGFNQFYFNSHGDFYKFLPGLLQLVGAGKIAALVQQANEIFEKENSLITQHWDGSLEGFSESYKNNPLNALDTVFYNLYKEEDLYQLQVNFIRSHKADFIG